MEKNTYETYEFIPDNTNSEQFFIVQDDGTFLVNRNIQYVTQVQDVKEPLEGVQTCTVYDVSSQQFLVDVDNSSELMSVSDQFVLPDVESSLYANSFLVQPGASTSNEQIEEDIQADKFKQENTQVNFSVTAAEPAKETNCTEITLSDEQYQLLEQKGWILLEINNKIYVLDTFGLHDITTNYKLIQKLKEDQCVTQETVNGLLKIDSKNTLESISVTLPSEDETNFIITDNIVQTKNNAENVSVAPHKAKEELHREDVDTPGIISSSECKPETTVVLNEESQDQDSDSGTRVLVIENDDIRREGSTLKIKTKLSLKGFPDKLILGSTLNGKKLIAKVVKKISEENKIMDVDDNPEGNSQLTQNKSTDEEDTNLPAIHLNNGNLLSESEFAALIQHIIQQNVSKCNQEDVIVADSVISQLLKIPTFKSTVLDSNLVVTKTVQSIEQCGKAVNKGLTAIVTGRVDSLGGEWHFVHQPYMLQKIVNNTEVMMRKSQDDDLDSQSLHVLHVQIIETKQQRTNIVRVSVTVNKRSIPMRLICSSQKQPPSMTYACSACAALFKTEQLLKDHQVNHCLEPEDMLTIDMDQPSTPTDYGIVNKGKTRLYSCLQCDAKFNRLTSCKNHLKTHSRPKPQESTEEKSKVVNSGGVFKCNMCPCTYFHPSTLSKHILSRHIKVKS